VGGLFGMRVVCLNFFLVLNLIGCNIWMYSIVGMQIGLEWDYLDEYF